MPRVDPRHKIRLRTVYLSDDVWDRCVEAARAAGHGAGKKDGAAVSQFLASVICDATETSSN